MVKQKGSGGIINDDMLMFTTLIGRAAPIHTNEYFSLIKRGIK
jgi:hypothetical protein